MNRIVLTGLLYLGTPYLRNAPAFQADTFDCSSFTQYVFGANGILLPRSSRQQFQKGQSVPLWKIQAGDLIFFKTKQRQDKSGIENIGHVAIYIGGTNLLHTYQEGKMVMISPFHSYWKRMYVGAKRII
ncbi:C40 family peptidase [Ectobacillus sp. sgz5001026]|uniref:C40 family peptidase n=1 Tax=Ectobacillus sp. sgz5001026 TaxID=3242473 RepID=UPI0036D34639